MIASWLTAIVSQDFILLLLIVYENMER